MIFVDNCFPFLIPPLGMTFGNKFLFHTIIFFVKDFCLPSPFQSAHEFAYDMKPTKNLLRVFAFQDDVVYIYNYFSLSFGSSLFIAFLIFLELHSYISFRTK